MNGICQELKIQLKRLARGSTLVRRHNRKMPKTTAYSNVCNRYVLKRLLQSIALCQETNLRRENKGTDIPVPGAR